MCCFSLIKVRLHSESFTVKTNNSHKLSPSAITAAVPLREEWAEGSCLPLGWRNTGNCRWCRESRLYGSGRAASTPSTTPPRGVSLREEAETEPGRSLLMLVPQGPWRRRWWEEETGRRTAWRWGLTKICGDQEEKTSRDKTSFYYWDFRCKHRWYKTK